MEGLLRNETFRDKFKGKQKGLIISTCNLIEEDARYILRCCQIILHQDISSENDIQSIQSLGTAAETLTATTKKPDNIKSGMPSYRRESSV